jgi:hypothetical protein
VQRLAAVARGRDHALDLMILALVDGDFEQLFASDSNGG